MLGRRNVIVLIAATGCLVAGYLTLARNDIKADNFNYFLDNHGENNVIFNVAR